MKKLTLASSFVFLLFLASCERAFVQPDLGPKPIQVDTKTAQLIQNNNQFGLELFKEVANNTDTTKNLMISPLSASLALSMTYNGAAGTTKTAFENTFHYDGMTTEEINQSMNDLCNKLTGVDPLVTFKLANSIWYKNTFNVEQNFLNVNKTYYNAEVRALNFSDPNSTNTINNWVNDNTNGKIPTIIDQIDPLTVMYLINATYFKGNWRSKFDPSQTINKPFTLENGTVKEVPTMSQETKMGLLSNDMFTAVELPYGRGNFSMVLILPNTDKTIQDVEDAMNQTNWKTWMENMQDSVSRGIRLPKFTFSYKKILNQGLRNLGLGIAFDKDNADFSKINPNVKPLYITEVKQKDFIKVDEEGTEAAAVTSVSMGATSVGPLPYISFNRPFLFVIKEKFTGTILFIGRVMDPSQN